MRQSKIYTPAELLEKIDKEQQNSFVYRGESSVFPPPLWPSKYRGFFQSELPVDIEPDQTIRAVGRSFYFRLNIFRDMSAGKDFSFYQERFKLEQIKHTCMAHIRNALGYALSEAMFQQAGWSSEGVDVSYEAATSMTFALTKWVHGTPIIEPRSEPAVFYRFKVSDKQWTFEDLRKYNFFSCPTFVPTREICRLFRTGTYKDFQKSLVQYQKMIKWTATDFDLDDLQNSRPFEFICLPESWTKSSRVEQQHAALLLPDSCRSEHHSLFAQRQDLGMMQKEAIDPHGNRLSVKDCLHHGSFVEDLSNREGVEKFLIDISSQKNIDEVLPYLNTKLLPETDPSFDLLSNWIKPFYQEITSYGTLPWSVNLSRSMTPETLWEVLSMMEPERQFHK